MSTDELFWKLFGWPVLDDKVLENVREILESPDTHKQLYADEASRRYPLEIRQKLHQAGIGEILFGATEESNGRSTVPHLYALIYLCSRSSVSIGIDVGVNALGLLPIYRVGTSEQKARVAQAIRDGKYFSFLVSEKDHGSDVFSNEFFHDTGLVDGNTVYSLSGEKDWINGGGTHEYHLVLSRDKDSLRARTTARSFTLFLTHTDDKSISVTRKWRNCPAPAADISSVVYRQHTCRRTDRVGKTGSGFSVMQDAFSVTRGVVGVGAWGLASKVTDAVNQQLSTRCLYHKPLIEIEVIAEKLEQVRALELIIGCLVMKCLYIQNCFGVGASHYSNITKYASTKFLENMVILGKDLLSARSLLQEFDFHRVLRDYPLFAVFDGTADICLEQVQSKLTQCTTTLFSSSVSLKEFSEIFTSEPRSCHDSFSQENDGGLILFRTDDYAAATDVGDAYDIDIHFLSSYLMHEVEILKNTGQWFKHQTLRHDAAKALVHLECIFAINDICARNSGRDRLASAETRAVAICAEKVSRHLLMLPAADDTKTRRLSVIHAESVAQQRYIQN